METVGSLGLWAGFAAIVVVMLAIDLFVVGGGVSKRAQQRIQPKLDELRRVHEALKGDLAKRYQI